MSINSVSSFVNGVLPPAATGSGAAPGRLGPGGDSPPAAPGDLPVQAVQAATRVQPSAEDLKRMAGELQRLVAPVAPEIEFSVDEDSGRAIIKLTDRTTGEIIRQFPSDETLHITQEIDHFQKGLLLNRKV